MKPKECVKRTKAKKWVKETKAKSKTQNERSGWNRQKVTWIVGSIRATKWCGRCTQFVIWPPSQPNALCYLTSMLLFRQFTRRSIHGWRLVYSWKVVYSCKLCEVFHLIIDFNALQKCATQTHFYFSIFCQIVL